MDSARSNAVRICLGIVLAAGAAPSPAPAEPGGGTGGTPPLRVFTARETGVATMAWSATQDPDGRMYFGCDTVVSFDGDRWHPEAMDPTDLVRGLDAGPDGRIWAAAENQIGWFDQGPHGRLAYHSLMARLAPDAADLGDVWRVYSQGPGTAVFVTWNRVLRWDGRAMASWSLPGMHLLWSTRTPRGIYVNYPPLGIMRITDAGPVVAVPASVVGPAPVGWLDDSGPDWLLMTPQGFKRLHDGTCTLLDSPASAFVRANTATSAARLRDGTLAVGTLKGGVALVGASGEILRTFSARTGLPSNQVYALFVDRDGALWGMGPAHIFRLGLGSGTSLYGPRNGYPPDGSDALASAGASLFIASHNDVLRLEPDATPGGAGVFAAFGPSSSRLYSLLSVSRGLAVGHLHGLGLWSRGAAAPVGPLDESVYRMNPSHARPGRILASLAGRVVSVDPDTGDSAVVADSLPDYGDTVVDEASGRVWIGTGSRGLLVAEPGTTHAVPAGSMFGSVPASGPAFVTLAGSTVVALTGTGGFYLDERTRRFQGIAGYPDGTPSAVSNGDASGAVWAALYPDAGAHASKLGRIAAKHGGGAAWSPRSAEGLAAAGTVLGLRFVPSRAGEDLWVSGTEALLRMDPSAISGHRPPPAPHVRAWIVADGAANGAPATGTLPYSTRGVHIEFSSGEFGMREMERYETLLGGAELQWSPPGDSTERDISGLREGSYDFEVRLVTDSGEAGDPSVLRFTIAPPWWRTPAARAGLAVLAVLATLGVLRLRTRSLKRRAEILAEMVRRRTEELERANAAKTDFVTSMSHEIRNPMGGILASALELAETPLERGQQQLVTTLQSCALYLASLVEDVLDFAAIEAGSYTVIRSGFSPREILDTVATMLGTRAAHGAIAVAIDPELPGRLVGDPGRIQQVVVNFAANSLKFGARHVWLSARADAGSVVYSVADDGVGIPADEQKNLFIRFSRLKSARNSAIPGTGLGLAVCRALAERMGGTVGFAPAPGGGSIFLLRLPIEADAGGPPAPAYEAHGMTALVVEDIDYNARSLALMLGRLGFEVSVAADGEEALGLLSSRRFDAIFLDCDLPGLEGAEVARRFRGLEPRGEHVRIVATTALSSVADRDACLAAGMDAFLTKPITPQKLLGVLGRPGGSIPDLQAPGNGGAPGGGVPALDLGLIAHLADGTEGSLGRELEKFLGALGEALGGVAAAHASGSRAAVASAAHRVLSLARMVGAESLSATAADVQDYAGAFTDAELADEVTALGERGRALRDELESLEREPPLSSFRGA